MDTKQDILDLTPDELREALAAMGEKSFRAKQIMEWIYKKHERDFAAMTNLAAGLREKLEAGFCVGTGSVETSSRSDDGRTVKCLFRLADGESVEAVSMYIESRHTVCLSSQVGCSMGCTFCATGGMGIVRDLTVGEMLLQFIELSRREGPISRVVFMGMGEPLMNLENVLGAVDALTDGARFAMGCRRITISTCGVIEGIRQLIRRKVPVRLAISLNSPFQKGREALMPICKDNQLKDLIDICDEYTEQTSRRVTLEYVLLKGVNSSPRHAEATARIARGLDAKVNVIEYNPVDGSTFASPTSTETRIFRETLESLNVFATVRYRRGRDIDAGCGQLATKHGKA
jgi:23S rRNA (adenine2503-C2)-methyltransferase